MITNMIAVMIVSENDDKPVVKPSKPAISASIDQ